MDRRRFLETAVAGGAVLGVAGGIAATAWLAPYPAEEAAVAAVREDSALRLRSERTSHRLEPADAEPWAGLVYSPGGLVEPAAYLPTLALVVERTAVAVSVARFPLGLAVVAADAAEELRRSLPDGPLLVGGHSLGGAMAARYAAANAERVGGLALHAAYPDRELAGSGLPTLVCLGATDGVLNREAERESRSLLPADAERVVLEGVNHAGFGAYGPQDGDGPLERSPAAAREAVADATAGWLAALRTG